MQILFPILLNQFFLTQLYFSKSHSLMDYVRQNAIQVRNMVFFKAHACGISFCLTWSIYKNVLVVQCKVLSRILHYCHKLPQRLRFLQ